MKALSPEYRYHLKIALVPLVVLLFLWRADIVISVGVAAVVLWVVYIGFDIVRDRRRKDRVAALEKLECIQDGALSLSSLTPDLEELETQASEMVGGKFSPQFLAAINALDSVEQMMTFLKSLPQDEDKDTLHSLTLSNETFYLLTLARLLTSVRHKILYEYRRKTGALTYQQGDRKPLLTRPELMRRLAADEREEFLSFCHSINQDEGGPSYFEERAEFLGATETADKRVAERPT